MEVVKEYWNSVESFYKSITPKCEKCQEVEKKIKCPLHYIAMAISVLLLVIFYLFTRKCGFFTYCAFFPALILCMKSVHDKKEESQKWSAYWFMFALLQMFPRCFDRNIYYGFIKCAALLYFAFFDDCKIIIQSFEMAYGYIIKGLDMYREKCCCEVCTKTD